MANLVLNSEFTTDLTNWTGTNATQVSGQSGLGAPVNTAVDLGDSGSMTQNITVPTGTTYVRYYVWISTDSSDADEFNFGVGANSDPDAPYTGTTNGLVANEYVARTYSFSGDGTTQTLSFNATAVSAGISYRVTSIYVGTSSSYCFNKGTKILCLKDNVEQYIPIEKLQKGNIVKTYLHGYRKIDSLMHSLFKNNVNEFTKSMYIMPKQGDMIDDLIVTGGHSILVDEYESEHIKNQHRHLFGGELDPIDDKQLLLASQSSKFKQLEGDDFYDIYHLCLEGETEEHDRRYGVWANGILTESTYKKIIYNIL